MADQKVCLRAELCKSKLLCSGKAETYEEAVEMCGHKTPRKMSCEDRTIRAMKSLDTVRNNIRDGMVDELSSDVGRIVVDLKACTKDPKVLELARKLQEDAKGIAGQYYYINEGKAVVKTLEALKQEIGIKGAKREAAEAEPSPAMSAYQDVEPQRIKPRTVAATGLGTTRPEIPSLTVEAIDTEIRRPKLGED